jgi:protease IV
VSLAKSAWRLLVGVKDGLVLLFMLIFFGALYAVLTASPNPGAVKEGALLLKLKGSIVEQPEAADPRAVLAGTADQALQYRLRDMLRAIDAAVVDDRIKVVVLDLDSFIGGGQTALISVGEALDKVRAAKKPVLAFATGYTDDSYLLAAHASEIWMDPMGMSLFAGPGGSRLYYKGLIDRLAVTTHVYRVGKYKSFVEPYIRSDQSPEAKQANQALVSVLWENWQQSVAHARPKAKIAGFVADPVAAIKVSNGDLAKAAVSAGVVDKLGDHIAFGKRVAEITGADSGQLPGEFRHTKLGAWLAANPASTRGDAIGVATVAGSIVDGRAPAGTAGGETISNYILKAVADGKIKGLVLRVDSGGGSAFASEKIRLALQQARDARIPVVVSMGSVAASGGYWVTTSADKVFAEPSTITGSIGVFGIIPTFENSLAKYGVTHDGVATTPLSGQPDIVGGTNATFDTVIQSSIEATYQRFLSLVSAARRMPVAKVDQIAQGRVWDGGTARQIGLVDAFGSLDEAVAEAARLAKLDPKAVHPEWLDDDHSWIGGILSTLLGTSDNEAPSDALTQLMTKRVSGLADALNEARAVVDGPAVQVRCLECPAPVSAKRHASLTALLMSKVFVK